ncbi:hypothetical protein [Rubinisphaera sp.]|uniref:hypothetical protein n=1 Tax=Rubinisphaera sp. TaxID=2024857 RepID=UPI000C1221A2|nr:hypothetical protein [Rubinisphaera sp.]MBV09706.1 hypothetical protein [Rubinisphaera sp.]HCS54119.1 hypothetical protein [Planctomycetaceae bacterium]|tara:strand:+ start:112 stop:561 length:450 start_codon:yes stop_codon:yes gene_type:complete
MTTKQYSADQMQSIFQHRFEYSRLLTELTDEQSTFISSQDYSGLIDLLMRKQTVIEALHQYSNGDPPLQQQWRELRDSLNSQDRAKCEKLLEETEQNLAEVMQKEATSTQEMQSQRDRTRAQLELVSGGIAVQDAYHDDSHSSQFDSNF